MKFLILLLLFYNFSLLGQKRTLTGKIISEDLEALLEVNIQTIDNQLIGTTDIDGNFEIKIPLTIDSLLISSLGMESQRISLHSNCNRLEIIMMFHGIYHYKSNKKIDRKRHKIFNQLDKVRTQAVNQNIFQLVESCYSQEFEPHKPELDEISNWMKNRKKEIKRQFQKLAIGDTIYIPFSGSWRANGTNQTSLFVFSSYVEGNEFECLVEGIIIDKNKKKRGYNLKFEVTDMKNCHYNSPIYNDKKLKTGIILRQNMKYFKLIAKDSISQK